MFILKEDESRDEDVLMGGGLSPSEGHAGCPTGTMTLNCDESELFLPSKIINNY